MEVKYIGSQIGQVKEAENIQALYRCIKRTMRNILVAINQN